MRGKFRDQGGLFSYISPETRVPESHPLRQVRNLVRDVLKQLSHSLGRLYSSEGRGGWANSDSAISGFSA